MSQKWNTYITLPASSNRKEFPKNKLSNYTVKLSDRIKLVHGKQEVALTQMIYPSTWYNIPIGKIFVKKTNDDDTETIQEVNIYSGSVSSAKELIERITKATKEMKFHTIFSLIYEEYSNKTSLIVYEPGYDVKLSNDLAQILGFETNKYYSIGVQSPIRTTDVHTLCQIMYIYSDIVASRPVGNIQSPLLRTIPVTGKFNQHELVEFKNPQYVQVNTTETDIINIVITTDEGNEIDFKNGKISITLHIRSIT